MPEWVCYPLFVSTISATNVPNDSWKSTQAGSFEIIASILANARKMLKICYFYEVRF